jgi:hypothetical protein
MEQDKIDKLKEASKGTRFSSENQPSPEAKSLGKKKQWEYKKLRQMFLEEMMDVELPDGRRVNFWEEALKIVAKKLLEETPFMDEDKRLRLIKEFLDIAPKDDNLNINSNVKKVQICFEDEPEKETESTEKTESDGDIPQTAINNEQPQK